VTPASGSVTRADKPRSPISVRAEALVADRRPLAEQGGRDLADHLADPDAFVANLRRALERLVDPEYEAGEHRIAPGLGPTLGVRWPLLAAVQRGLREKTRGERTTQFLFLADRLYREPELEFRWLAFGLLERVVVDDPERAWQLLRRAAREAADWITVDALAHPAGRGILLEPYRWAELEQLVFSTSRWERRLVGSTIATIPFIDRRRGRDSIVTEHGLPLIASLIGDSEPDVQKALAWALRSLILVDVEAVALFCADEAERAVADDDGSRAWVIRDTLAKLPEQRATALRSRLAGIRRKPGAASTSEASSTAARFASGAPHVDLADYPEPPLT